MQADELGTSRGAVCGKDLYLGACVAHNHESCMAVVHVFLSDTTT